MSRTLDPLRAEQDARTRWAALEPAPVVAADAEGRRFQVAPSDRLRAIERQARIITASTCLCEAVAARLGDHGVTALVDHVRVDPVLGREQVMAIRAGDRVVPVWPAGTVLRVHTAAPDIELDGEPVAVVEVTVEKDGWVPAETIAQALAPHLK